MRQRSAYIVLDRHICIADMLMNFDTKIVLQRKSYYSYYSMLWRFVRHILVVNANLKLQLCGQAAFFFRWHDKILHTEANWGIYDFCTLIWYVLQFIYSFLNWGFNMALLFVWLWTKLVHECCVVVAGIWKLMGSLQ